MGNLQRNLDSKRVNQAYAIQEVLLHANTYEEAVQYFAYAPMTSASHFIVGGTKGNEGVVLSRDEDRTVHRYELSDDQWYVAMTNVDVWQVKDKRYENAVSYLEQLGQANIQPDGKSIIEQVLW